MAVKAISLHVALALFPTYGFSYLPKMLNNCIHVSSISALFTVLWLEYTKKKQKHSIKILFYDPFSSKICDCKYYFKFDCQMKNCSSIKTREIILCCRRAEKSINICMFALSNIALTDTIIDIHKRGVLIRVIVNNSHLSKSSKELKSLQDVGIEIRQQKDTPRSYMHNKYIVVDSTMLIHGSMNWTKQATLYNWENAIITDSKYYAREYSKNFEKLWATFA